MSLLTWWRRRGLSDEEVAYIASNEFLTKDPWLQLRYATLERYGARCMACGRTPKDGITINIDHIKPRKYYPRLALDPNNTQPLCHQCNKSKGNQWVTDWRVTRYWINLWRAIRG